MAAEKVLVTGAGGFIGHALVNRLKQLGYWVRGVDLKLPEFAPSAADEFTIADLRNPANCLAATAGVSQVYALAADMGGMGFISRGHHAIFRNNMLINMHTLEAACANGVKRYLLASSACIYPEGRQERADVAPLREEDALPAQPQDGYGWEKLAAELLCGYYAAERGIEVRLPRFHNIFGPLGTYIGGREKAPAALCRKIAQAKHSGLSEIEIWGDGEQTRSFCYIDDCIDGVIRLMESGYGQPLNIGQDRMVTINELTDMIAAIAGIPIVKRHVDGPQGVRGRNSDNSRLRAVLNWEPQVSLEEGLARTYAWIEAQMMARADAGSDRHYSEQP
jgi:GDP-D-mannose 3',5'-epimerase